uniref:Uncharacterized protein n=1 Tax=Solanum tuberosum TaxID=4113 RepID=M1DD17_SOLTU
MVRKPSPFNLFSNLGGGGTTGSVGATRGGVGVGTCAVVGKVAGLCVPFLKKIKKKLKCKYKKVIADRLADLIGELPNLFGEPKQARRRDWVNNEEKTTIGMQIKDDYNTFGESPSIFGALRLLSESYRIKRQSSRQIIGGVGTLDEPPSPSASST